MAKHQSAQKDGCKKVNIIKLKRIIIIFIILGIAFFSWFDIIPYGKILEKLGLRSKIEYDENFSVHFIDVGNGDCTLITSKGHTMLIDCGEKEYSDKVISYLNAMNINTIDYFVLSHFHSDHIGGFSKIYDNFNVNEVIVSENSQKSREDSFSLYEFETKTEKDNINISYPRKDKIQLGKCTVNLFQMCTDNTYNNNSIICLAEYDELKLLITGDIEQEAEEKLVCLKKDIQNCDVLRVPHHGSNTSSTQSFLKVCNPKLCIISCGAGNSFKHPSSKVIKALNGFTDNVFRTDIYGNIKLEYKNKSLNIQTEKDG